MGFGGNVDSSKKKKANLNFMHTRVSLFYLFSCDGFLIFDDKNMINLHIIIQEQ